MNNFFDKTLHYLGKTSKSITALNIGSKTGSFTVSCADNHEDQSGHDLIICFSVS